MSYAQYGCKRERVVRGELGEQGCGGAGEREAVNGQMGERKDGNGRRR